MLNLEVSGWGYSFRLRLGRDAPNMLRMAQKNVILDFDGRPGRPDLIEAFIICDRQWVETGYAVSDDAFYWGIQAAWSDSDLWCYDPGEFYKNRTEFPNRSIYGIWAQTQQKGYAGPPSLMGMAEWAGVKSGTYEVASPLERCRTMAAIMRSPRMRA